MNLYQLSADFMAAKAALEAEDLPPEAIADTLEGLAMEWEDKAVNVARLIKNLEAEAAAIREAEREMEGRRKAIHAKAERLKAYLTDEVRRTGLTASAPDIGRVRLQKNPPSVAIDDESALPDWAFVTKREVARAEVLRALKSWGVPGARLVQTESLRIG